MPTQLCWFIPNWISVPSSRNITMSCCVFPPLHYCTVPYSSFFFKPVFFTAVIYVKLPHFPYNTNKKPKVAFQDYWEYYSYYSWLFMGLGSHPLKKPNIYWNNKSQYESGDPLSLLCFSSCKLAHFSWLALLPKEEVLHFSVVPLELNKILAICINFVKPYINFQDTTSKYFVKWCYLPNNQRPNKQTLK